MTEQSTTDSKFSFGNFGIAEILQTKKYSVPTYQRPYSWTDDLSSLRDQVQEFWNDVAEAKTAGDEYFLGTVVVSREGSTDSSRMSIVDGQQRLATTAILLAALRDVYADRDDESRSEVIQQEYIAKRDLASNTEIPQLQLNGEDDTFFRAFVVDGKRETIPSRDSHRDIKRAYNLLRSELDALATASGSRWNEELASWPAFLASKVRVVRVEVPTETEAFTIFETLNDRGADLTISDLLKILLFSRAGARIDTVRNSWIATMASLDVASEGGQIFNDFLRTFWSSKNGATRERELYSRIKSAIDDEAKAVALVSQLEAAAKTYHAILHPSASAWMGYKASTVKHLQVLLDLKLVQNRPLVLAAASSLTKPRFAKFVERLVNWSVRGLIVGGIGGGTAETLYCDAAAKVWDKSVKTPEQIRAELSDLIHRDTVFKGQFATATVSKGPLARYLLYVLERQNDGTSQPEMVPNEDVQDVNLEHVLPQNPTPAEWPDFTADDDVRSYRNRLGNQALLRASQNSRIGNKSFGHKAPILASSAFSLTKEVGSESQWTAAEIEARQARLAEIATKAWPI